MLKIYIIKHSFPYYQFSLQRLLFLLVYTVTTVNFVVVYTREQDYVKLSPKHQID